MRTRNQFFFFLYFLAIFVHKKKLRNQEIIICYQNGKIRILTPLPPIWKCAYMNQSDDRKWRFQVRRDLPKRLG